MPTIETDALFTTGEVQSTRDHVNVMFPFTTLPDYMNVYLAPARNERMPAKDAIRKRVQTVLDTMIKNHHIGWGERVTEITIRENYTERGLYHFTIWGKRENDTRTYRVTGPDTNEVFNTEQKAKSFIAIKCRRPGYVPAQFAITVER